MNIFELTSGKSAVVALILSIFSGGMAQPNEQIRQLKISAAQQSTAVALAQCSTRGSQPIEGVVVVLHGRGGHASTSDLARMFLNFACSKRLAVAAPAAPTKNQNWPFEKIQGEKQDLLLLELIKNILPRELGIKKELKTYLVGVSAGATFLMGDFYPRHGAQLKGFAAALCGGSAPTAAQISGLKQLEKTFPLFLQISRKDFLFQQTEQGLKKYAEMGLPLRARITDEPGHCAFNFAESLDLIEKQMR